MSYKSLRSWPVYSSVTDFSTMDVLPDGSKVLRKGPVMKFTTDNPEIDEAKVREVLEELRRSPMLWEPTPWTRNGKLREDVNFESMFDIPSCKIQTLEDGTKTISDGVTTVTWVPDQQFSIPTRPVSDWYKEIYGQQPEITFTKVRDIITPEEIPEKKIDIMKSIRDMCR